jgi:hypothetical protein
VAVYVGKNLTEDGSALLAGYGDEPSSHWMVIAPRRQHPPGATITVGGTGAARMPGRLREIPQAAQTYRYLSMDYSAFAGFPAPITNGGMNEHGLAVRDVALNSRRELVEMTPKDQQGVDYSDVARIVLERAKTAREAVEIAIDLVERYGDFSYGGNSAPVRRCGGGLGVSHLRRGEGAVGGQAAGAERGLAELARQYGSWLHSGAAGAAGGPSGLPGFPELCFVRYRTGMVQPGGGEAVPRD